MAPDERRREPRRPASGQVNLQTEQTPPLSICAKAVDRSVTGLRIRHDCRILEAGQRVRFQAAFGQGTAVVVWSRILPGSVETGLRFVDFIPDDE